MFTKLLKHEFRSVAKPLTIISIAALLAGGIGALLMWFTVSNIDISGREMFSVLSMLLLGGIYLGLIAYAVGAVIILYYRFYKNKFSDEGYLTFTLPVSTHQILLSTILNILIWSLIVMAVLFICIVLIVAPLFTQISQELHYYYSDLSYIMEEISYFSPEWPLQLLSVISNGIYSIVLPLLSITIGSLIAKKHKILAAFAVGYGISTVVSTASGFLMILDLMNSVDYMYETVGYSSTSIISSSITMLVIGVGGYFLMHYLIGKKLNI